MQSARVKEGNREETMSLCFVSVFLPTATGDIGAGQKRGSV